MSQRLVADVASSAGRDGGASRTSTVRRVIATNRIIDCVIRGTNWLLATKAQSLVPNIYFSGKAEHYSSTLCRIFIIKIVLTEGKTPYGYLEDILAAFGHKRLTVRRETDALLAMRVLFSNKGFTLLPDSDQRSDQIIHDRELPFAQYLIEDLGCSLRYLQGMAYVTPMAGRFRSCVRIPSTIRNEVDNFRDRVSAAAALYRQVLADTTQQMQYVSVSDDKVRLLRLASRFEFDLTAHQIRRRIFRDLQGIARSDPEFAAGLNRMKLFPSETGGCVSLG